MEQKFGKTSILGQAMMPCRVWRVSGEELFGFFRQSIKDMELRAVIGEHMLNQFKARYQDSKNNLPKIALPKKDLYREKFMNLQLINIAKNKVNNL